MEGGVITRIMRASEEGSGQHFRIKLLIAVGTRL